MNKHSAKPGQASQTTAAGAGKPLVGPRTAGPNGKLRALDEGAKRFVVSGLDKGFTLTQVASFLAVSRKTILRERRRDPLFDTNVKRALEMRGMAPLDVVIQASKRDWRAAAWLVTHLRTVEKEARTARDLRRWLQQSSSSGAAGPAAQAPPPAPAAPIKRPRLPAAVRFELPPQTPANDHP